MALKVKCKECGSTDIEVQAWVNPNKDWTENPQLDFSEVEECYCHKCNKKCGIQIVEE